MGRRPAVFLGAALAVIAIGLAVAWLAIPQTKLPAGGISRDHAIGIAARQIPSDPPATVQLASAGPMWKFAADAQTSPNRFVWAVNFKGTYGRSCGPHNPNSPQPRHCAPATNLTVILDYFDGSFIMASLV